MKIRVLRLVLLMLISSACDRTCPWVANIGEVVVKSSHGPVHKVLRLGDNVWVSHGVLGLGLTIYNVNTGSRKHLDQVKLSNEEVLSLVGISDIALVGKEVWITGSSFLCRMDSKGNFIGKVEQNLVTGLGSIKPYKISTIDSQVYVSYLGYGYVVLDFKGNIKRHVRVLKEGCSDWNDYLSSLEIVSFMRVGEALYLGTMHNGIYYSYDELSFRQYSDIQESRVEFCRNGDSLFACIWSGKTLAPMIMLNESGRWEPYLKTNGVFDKGVYICPNIIVVVNDSESMTIVFTSNCIYGIAGQSGEIYKLETARSPLAAKIDRLLGRRLHLDSRIYSVDYDGECFWIGYPSGLLKIQKDILAELLRENPGQ